MATFSESTSGTPDDLVGARVTDAGGDAASIVSVQQGGGDSSSGPQAWIRLGDGTQMLVPVSLLARDDDGYRLPFAFHNTTDSRHPTQMSFPVMEEDVRVGKRVIDTGRGVRLHKTVVEREQVLDEPLLQDRLEVEHVQIGRLVSESDQPQVRYEGDTLVVPVLEEVLVVQKQLMLKEEVRIVRRREEVRKPETVVLRSEQVQVERFDEGRRPS
jgi:stress response protein YsnF